MNTRNTQNAQNKDNILNTRNNNNTALNEKQQKNIDYLQKIILAAEIPNIKSISRLFLIRRFLIVIAKKPEQSIEDIAKRVKCHKVTIYRIALQLKEKRILEIQHNWKKRKNGHWEQLVNTYYINKTLLESYISKDELTEIKNRFLVDQHVYQKTTKKIIKNEKLVDQHGLQNANPSYTHGNFVKNSIGNDLNITNKPSVNNSYGQKTDIALNKEAQPIDLKIKNEPEVSKAKIKDNTLTREQQISVDKLDFKQRKIYDELDGWRCCKVYALGILEKHDLAKIIPCVELARMHKHKGPKFTEFWGKQMKGEPIYNNCSNIEKLEMQRKELHENRKKEKAREEAEQANTKCDPEFEERQRQVMRANSMLAYEIYQENKKLKKERLAKENQDKIDNGFIEKKLSEEIFNQQNSENLNDGGEMNE